MTGIEFRKWIEAGYSNYGRDPWFFIRELAQNSRDAGAKTIHIKAGRTAEKNETLIFEDDGRGMSYAHAKRYLFRLYASSKTEEKYSAGMFGIGFWTVLKFNPEKIVIESSFKKEKWAVLVDGDLNTTRIACGLTSSGTRITLVRPCRETSAGAFLRKAREAVVRYCSYLRRNSRRSEPLPVFFAGENITRNMKLPGPVSLSFNSGTVEGAVGLAPRPRVKLYARGLPVWEGTTLEELSHTPPAGGGRRKQEFGQGLAPVFLLNGNHLEVNISRKKVIDNRHLQQVRRSAEKVLAQMVQMAADCVSPRGLGQRFKDKIKYAGSSIFRSFGKTLLLSLIIIIPLEVAFLTSFFKSSPKASPGTTFSILAEKTSYPGASVRTTTAGSPPDLTYHPPKDTWFKLFSVDDYRIDAGFLQAAAKKKEVSFPAVNCTRENITVQLKTSETGRIYLPQPQPVSPGFSIVPGSITFNGAPLASAGYYAAGEVVVTLPGSGIIRYRCCPAGKEPVLSRDLENKLSRLPENLSLPPAVEKELRESAHLAVYDKIKKALDLTAGLLKYDDSATTVKKYTRSSGSSDWLKKVLTIGAGDCDILNGVNALFLRKMGVPARLVIGLIGRKGKILPGLHAWTEYYAGGRHIIDATAHTPGLRGAAHPGQKAPAVNTGARWNLFRRAVIYFLAGLFMLSSILLFFMVSRYAKRRKPFPRKALKQVEENLAGIALHALLYPGTWGRSSSIRDLKLIPTINGRFVSLRQALKLGKEQELFTTGSTSPLAPYLRQTSKSLPILDSGNPAFAPLIRLLPGAVHLEKIVDLKIIPMRKTAGRPVDRLLTAVNHRLKAGKNKTVIPPLLLAPGLCSQDEDFFDADLSPLPSLTVFGIPNRFIAVNPNSTRVKKLAALFQKNPPLSQFRLISAVLEESRLVPYPSTGLIEEVSRQLFKEMQ